MLPRTTFPFEKGPPTDISSSIIPALSIIIVIKSSAGSTDRIIIIIIKSSYSY
jgi:hypothetical protein